MNTTETKGIALITGASSGIGAVYADRLAKRGHDLILVARNLDRLASLARRLTGDTGRRVETAQADLTSPSDLRRVEDILRTNAAISLLINNAGLGAVKPRRPCRFRYPSLQPGHIGPARRAQSVSRYSLHPERRSPSRSSVYRRQASHPAR